MTDIACAYPWPELPTLADWQKTHGVRAKLWEFELTKYHHRYAASFHSSS